jgi:tRNA pseudouridine55 synthase
MNKVSWHGLLNVDKPEGITSRKVVDHVLRLARPAKVGHAGTLDPMATGVLVVCVGAATRLISCVQEQRKTYLARFRFGCVSDTDDRTGQVTVVEHAVVPTREQVAAALANFCGEISQIPPQFSAVHVQGKRAYDLARAGKEISLQPRVVTVCRNIVLKYDYPDLELEIECGSGTYIRSIARDLGAMLGCGAVMEELRRTGIGPFDVSSAVSLDQLSAHGLEKHLLPTASAVVHLPRYQCTAEDVGEIVHGRAVHLAGALGFATTRVALVTNSGELAALAECSEDGSRLEPTHVFARPAAKDAQI